MLLNKEIERYVHARLFARRVCARVKDATCIQTHHQHRHISQPPTTTHFDFTFYFLLFFPFPTWKKKLSVYEALCHVPFPSFTNVAPTFRAMEYIYMYDRLQVESCIVLEISGVSLWKMNVHLGIVASLTCNVLLSTS